ncbi:MAG: ParA family protein [Candidatus Brocadia sp. AMX2]|uniref:Chromosome partitioning protein n=1 Tax=Candidatus Brocadia sinica JPN1 TaxID=1197129 RepID=A0ABQ0K0R5_9BACT|nr:MULTISPECIES: AAA family ATPase [Brocadia]KXK25387.1 MAG: chromosome partitioning protein [Candidatus Brocadia sinica]MBC6933513.1 ParA family protein [Candidatus Brocadia sp.]MBL1170350.1 ParA family protein [Candidatus Brocadia sp. AMX1]NOG42142.1 ParA family protein [Planctomycetota bacterium]KAA0242598.1 MAG: ParA family protein [Candidatus Brocadia sp. AMX2]
MRSIALLNQKGGVGKTTTTANLGACLAMLGKKVLVIDMDPQANLSVHLGVDIHNLKYSVYNLMKGECTPEDVLLNTGVQGLDIIPANIELAGAEIELVGVVGRETVLKEYLGQVLDKYDYVLVDCPPSLGLLTLNVLTLVQELFIPLQTEFFALQGVSKLLETYEVVRKRLNHDLEITGIIFCMYTSRTRLCNEVIGKIKEYPPLGDKAFNTIIRKNIKLSESPSHGKPIVSYAPDSHGSEDYMALAKEVVQRENSRK